MAQRELPMVSTVHPSIVFVATTSSWLGAFTSQVTRRSDGRASGRSSVHHSVVA